MEFIDPHWVEHTYFLERQVTQASPIFRTNTSVSVSIFIASPFAYAKQHAIACRKRSIPNTRFLEGAPLDFSTNALIVSIISIMGLIGS